MSKITIDMIERVYLEGKNVVKNGIKESEAAEYVSKATNMNYSSAKMHIKSVVAMLTGDEFGRTINGDAFEYYLDHIFLDYGVDGLARALSVFDHHAKKQLNPLYNLKEISNNYRLKVLCEKTTQENGGK